MWRHLAQVVPTPTSSTGLWDALIGLAGSALGAAALWHNGRRRKGSPQHDSALDEVDEAEEEEIHALNARVRSLEAVTARAEQRLDRNDTRIERLEGRSDRADERVDRMEEKVDRIVDRDAILRLDLPTGPDDEGTP